MTKKAKYKRKTDTVTVIDPTDTDAAADIAATGAFVHLNGDGTYTVNAGIEDAEATFDVPADHLFVHDSQLGAWAWQTQATIDGALDPA